MKQIRNAANDKVAFFDYLNNIPKHVSEILFDPKTADDKLLDLCKEFLPAACDQGDADVLLALLAMGANPSLRGTKVLNRIVLTQESRYLPLFRVEGSV